VHDIVLIQEHWLLPDELTMLHHINPDFHSHALLLDVASMYRMMLDGEIIQGKC